MVFWRLFRCGTNHPSIAHRGVSCSKVGLGEPIPNNWTIIICFENKFKDFSLVVFILRISLKRIVDC